MHLSESLPSVSARTELPSQAQPSESMRLLPPFAIGPVRDGGTCVLKCSAFAERDVPLLRYLLSTALRCFSVIGVAMLLRSCI